MTGSVDLMPLLLFAIVFIWTPPHFWSLALFANDDYRRAGVPMLPVVAGAKRDPAPDRSLHLAAGAADIDAMVLGFSGPVYAIAAGVLGFGFLVSGGGCAPTGRTRPASA